MRKMLKNKLMLSTILLTLSLTLMSCTTGMTPGASPNPIKRFEFTPGRGVADEVINGMQAKCVPSEEWQRFDDYVKTLENQLGIQVPNKRR